MSDESDTLEEAVRGGLYAEFSTDAAKALLEEFMAYKRDAERYRKLRAMHWSRSPLCVVGAFSVGVGEQTYRGDQLDKAWWNSVIARRQFVAAVDRWARKPHVIEMQRALQGLGGQNYPLQNLMSPGPGKLTDVAYQLALNNANMNPPCFQERDHAG